MLRSSFLGSLSLAIALALPFSARADVPHPTGSKADDIRRLLVLTGAGHLGAEVLTQLVGSLKKMVPHAPEQFWVDFQKEVKTDDLLDLIVPVYDRHLTQEEVKALIKFYETPTGKKFVTVLPGITQETMAAGEAWGRGLAEQVLVRLQPKEAAPKADGKSDSKPDTKKDGKKPTK